MKKHFLAVALMAASLSSYAGELYTGLGTTGVTLGYEQLMGPRAGTRYELNHMSTTGTVTAGSATYDYKMTGNSLATFFDFYPFVNSGFRFTTGAFIGSPSVDMAARSQVFVQGTYALLIPGDSVSVKAKTNTVMPYVGLGYRSGRYTSGLHFFADAGVSYVKPELSLTASPDLVALAGQARINQEAKALQDQADKQKFFPVLRVGVSFAF